MTAPRALQLQERIRTLTRLRLFPSSSSRPSSTVCPPEHDAEKVRRAEVVVAATFLLNRSLDSTSLPLGDDVVARVGQTSERDPLFVVFSDLPSALPASS